MRILMFYHSLLSDWNHGNAHFLRGVATELLRRGHEVKVFEPRNSWSAQNLVAEHGSAPLRQFHAAYPALKAIRYDLKTLDLEKVLEGADLVLVHEWNDPSLVARLGRFREENGAFALFFHDTHHRMVTAPRSMAAYDLAGFDGVLAYGRALTELYERSHRVRAAWTWHEAADTRLFRPLAGQSSEGDLVWIGNWGDGERTAELEEFLVRPVKTLGLRTRVHGVRYPEKARQALGEAQIDYAGWLPNFEVPQVYARFKATVHIPRRPYVQALPGIPTIRPFEAMACGIPLVCSAWDDVEGLFEAGEDYLLARNGREMTHHLNVLLHDEDCARALVNHGLKTIRSRHTCAHRVDELLAIAATIFETQSSPALV